ncbi:MAG: hypothetical protein ACI861_000001 [Paracoccaceae bacterium]
MDHIEYLRAACRRLTVIKQALGSGDLDGLKALLREYPNWDIDQLAVLSGVTIDPEVYVRNIFKEIAAYFPPRGRLFPVRSGSELVGMAFLRPVRKDACEVKRMYVRPDQSRQWLGAK